MWVGVKYQNCKKSEEKLPKRRCTFLHFLIILLLCIVYTHFFGFFQKYFMCQFFSMCQNRASDDTKAWESDKKEIKLLIKELRVEMRTKTLISSIPRSGSSFLGELFNLHDDVFYLYEPLHSKKTFAHLNLIPQHSYNMQSLNLIQDISVCNFRKHQDFLSFISNPDLSNPHFRSSSRILASPPFCKHHILVNYTEEEYRRNCYHLNANLVEIYCNKYNHVVIKELVHRLPYETIRGLQPLLKDHLIRIIYLVRDPRAVIHSMINAEWIGSKETSFSRSVSTAISKVCKMFTNNYRHINANKYFYKSRLLLVRYEDLVTQPEEVIEELFKFTDIEVYDKIFDWAIENIHGQFSNTNANKIFSVLLRNATFSLNSWRTRLTINAIFKMQGKCGSTMQKLGYNLFLNKAQVSNFSLPTFTNQINVAPVVKVS